MIQSRASLCVSRGEGKPRRLRYIYIQYIYIYVCMCVCVCVCVFVKLSTNHLRTNNPQPHIVLCVWSHALTNDIIMTMTTMTTTTTTTTVAVRDYSCDYTVIQKSLLMNMAVAMIAPIMTLVIIRPLMIMMIASLFSLCHPPIWTHHFCLTAINAIVKRGNWKRKGGGERQVSTLALITRHASAKMHAFISAINRSAVSVASLNAPALTHTHLRV